MSKAYPCLPPGEEIGGADLAQSSASFTGGSGDSVPSTAELKRGYSDAELSAADLADGRLNFPFLQRGDGGFCGRPNGWER